MRPTIELPISISTGHLIDILRKYHELYSDAIEAVQQAFGEKDGYDILNETLYKEYDALEERLKELIMMSITENLLPKNPTEI